MREKGKWVRMGLWIIIVWIGKYLDIYLLVLPRRPEDTKFFSKTFLRVFEGMKLILKTVEALRQK